MFLKEFANKMVSFVLKTLKYTILFSLLIFFIHCWLTTKSYVFSENLVASYAKKHVGSKDIEKTYKAVHRELKAAYPAIILDEKDLQWIFMNAGGWMGSVCILHASFTEYILFFGSAIDTNGHSGRYWANVSDTVLTGEFRQWPEGSLKVNVYKPGDTVLHAWGEVTAVEFKAGTWMLEYGRGFIPSALTFALADTFFSTTDLVTLYYILRVYAKAMLQYACWCVTNLLTGA